MREDVKNCKETAVLVNILLKANIDPLKNMWYVPEGYGTFNDALPSVYYLNINLEF